MDEGRNQRIEGTSYIWKNMLKNCIWMMSFLKWKVENGQMIEIGLDAIKGIMGKHSLSTNIIHSIHNRDIKYISHIKKDHNLLTFIQN